MKPGKGRNSKHSIMANSGKWSEVTIVQEGVKKLDWV